MLRNCPVSRVGLSVPKQQEQTLLRGWVLLAWKSIYGRLYPKVLIGRQQEIDEDVIMSQAERMLRNEYLEIRPI